ncbi:hypothetical protein [Halorhabdus amylolytica]|uniref:hypothetical protein n=1 Tax=Halorhabdus amylolytica TaxID=2559573 RepID=UPI0010AA6F64|nr:hypothetical protein [Halorhabdus amylolytica]
MVRKIEFGSRDAANDTRGRIEGFLAESDSRVEKTIQLKESTPDRIVERVESEGYGSQTSDRQSYGKAKLSESERESLNRQHRNFSWQQHGFEAMAVKAAMQSQGVTEWMDYYEPGEGVESALSKVRDAKGSAQQTRASQGIGGKRTDQEETGNRGRRARQAERAQSGRVDSAKEPALLNQDTDALDFLREEQRFEDDIFDIAFSQSDSFGRPVGSGRDYQTLRERHEQRSERAQELDEQKHAPTTRDPIKWSQNPGEYDFPGIDTLNPSKKHESRSDRAQEVDENEQAPLAESPAEWATNMDALDLPGIDTPDSGLSDTTPTPGGSETPKQGSGGNSGSKTPGFVDDRAQQTSLDIGPDPTQARESRFAVEESEGGLFEDTRDDPGRGFDMGDAQKGRQEALGEMLGMDSDDKQDMSDFMP